MSSQRSVEPGYYRHQELQLREQALYQQQWPPWGT